MADKRQASFRRSQRHASFGDVIGVPLPPPHVYKDHAGVLPLYAYRGRSYIWFIYPGNGAVGGKGKFSLIRQCTWKINRLHIWLRSIASVGHQMVMQISYPPTLLNAITNATRLLNLKLIKLVVLIILCWWIAVTLKIRMKDCDGHTTKR